MYFKGEEESGLDEEVCCWQINVCLREQRSSFYGGTHSKGKQWNPYKVFDNGRRRDDQKKKTQFSPFINNTLSVSPKTRPNKVTPPLFSLFSLFSLFFLSNQTSRINNVGDSEAPKTWKNSRILISTLEQPFRLSASEHGKPLPARSEKLSKPLSRFLCIITYLNCT